MAIKFTEGFDWTTTYNQLNTLGKWVGTQSRTDNSTGSVSATAGRNGNGLRWTNSSATLADFYLHFSGTNSTGFVYLGFAFRVSALPTSANPGQGLVTLYDGVSTPVAGVALSSAGTLQLFRGAATAISTSAPGGVPVIAVNTWYHVEIKCKRTASSIAGDFQVRLNGSLAIEALAGTNLTGGGSGTGLSDFKLGCVTAHTTALGATIDYDDVFFIDDTGTINNTWLGDSKIETLIPTGDGGTSAWSPTPSGAGTNWQRVKETPPDGDTSYVADGGLNTRDTYLFGSLSSTPNAIYCVSAQLILADNLASNARKVTVSVNSGGTTTDSGQSPALPSTYVWFEVPWQKNQTTLLPWTAADVNALEAGVKLAV